MELPNRVVRNWSKQEEILLLDVWESNIYTNKFTTMKDMHISMQKEMSLHFDISVKDIRNKMYNMQRQYKKALCTPQMQVHWEPFKRLESILKAHPIKSRNRNNASPHTICLNGNSTDESIWTFDDSCQEYIGCEPEDISINCEPDINAFQLEIQNPLSAAPALNDEIIELDDDDDETEEKSAQIVNQPIEFVRNFTIRKVFDATQAAVPTVSELANTALNQFNLDTSLKQFSPIQSVKTIESSSSNDVNATSCMASLNNVQQTLTAHQTADKTNFAPKVYLCQPVQPQLNTATETLNSSSKKSVTLEKLKPKITKRKDRFGGDISTVLEKLTSISDSLQNFVQVQENLSRQIYREGLQQTMVLTRILEEEQRRTKLMELMVKDKE